MFSFRRYRERVKGIFIAGVVVITITMIVHQLSLFDPDITEGYEYSKEVPVESCRIHHQLEPNRHNR